MIRRFLQNNEATEQFGAELYRLLPSKSVIFLEGELGTGKTTLVRGFLKAAGYNGPVKSPTYTLVEEYSIGNRKFYHFDLYRLTDPEELEWIGIRDYFEHDCVCFIEWPGKGLGFLPPPDYTIRLIYQNEGRLLTLESRQNAIKFDN